ncbi:hypothetical protein KDA00_03695 [Candidatus Saccharibacteria bacterium]|nr:hypothetical protein [Candidatus Saccharibacteria bacterium]
MNQQGITIEYKNNFLGTFISTLVAVLVAVPVAMFVSYTVLKAGNASASTNSQTATASPVNTIGYPVYAANSSPSACTAPEGSTSDSGSGMSYLPGGGLPQYVINNTSTINQSETENNTTTNNSWITDSYNDNSVNDSNNTNIDVRVKIKDSFQDNDTTTTVNDNSQDNSTDIDVDIRDSFTIEDSFPDNSVNQTAIGLLAGNIND